MKNLNQNIFKIVFSMALALCTTGQILASVDSVSSFSLVSSTPKNNPGYLGCKQAITIMGVTNFTKLLRNNSGYQTNFAINYEKAKKASLSYQFGYKGINTTIEQDDWNVYKVHLKYLNVWGYTEYRPVGTMAIQYREFTMGVKYYMAAFGSTAPYGVYTLANLHLGLAKCKSSDLQWELFSGFPPLPDYDASSVKGSLISMSYGFGARNVIMDKLGLVTELTSGFTLKNSGGFSVYSQYDYYAKNFHGVNPADVMRRVMLREFHKSQWVQLKFGLSYLF